MRLSLSKLAFGFAALLATAAHGQQLGQQLGQPAEVDLERAAVGPLSVPRTSMLFERDSLGLPSLRPRLTMTMPLAETPGVDERDRMFSWSLEAWQMNTASLAHIQCNRLTSTIDSFLAEDCHFVDEPVPDGSVNLVRLGGQWTAAPGLELGVGAFSGQVSGGGVGIMEPAGGSWFSRGERIADVRAVDGVDAGVSFGIAHDRVGDFLVGLQVARYRQRMSLLDLGLGSNDPQGLSGGDFQRYANSAQLALGWRRGSLSGDLVGQARDMPLWMGPGQYRQAMLHSFDLELSWRAVRNASISIGVSNLLDAAPRSADETTLDPGLEDPLENIYGRIPYVRYKHDL